MFGHFFRLFKDRFNVLIVFAIFLFAILTISLGDLQLVKGAYYQDLAQRRMYKDVPIKAPRGEILDRFGRKLATNKIAYNIIINDENLSERQLNISIANLLHILGAHGHVYRDTLPISDGEPYTFEFDQNGAYPDETSLRKFLQVPANYTAADIINYLKKDCGLDEVSEFNSPQIRQIIGVRYDMLVRMFGPRSPFVFYTDIDISLVTSILESTDKYQSVEIVSEPIRQYPGGNLGVHFLGQVGNIYKEEYDELKDKGYSMNDTIGKDGLEKYLESYLRGTDGKSGLQYMIQDEALVLGSDVAAVPGSQGVLTIDSTLQRVADEALADAITTMRAGGASENAGGAVVAIDVSNGEILALSNFPTYDLATFKEDYEGLINDPANPIFNRAIAGIYPPGSTFKAMIGIAGLEEGIITGHTHINCTGVYEFYKDVGFEPACWIYNDYGGQHGSINVISALEVSCNIFFFETGRQLGIETIDKYGTAFGFGKYTEIELPGEQSGYLSSPASKELLSEEDWMPGDTVQTSIGQSYNLVTPLQLANYVATIANGGTRYRPHIVRNVISYDGSSTLYETPVRIEDKIDISPATKELIFAGMHSVATNGSPKAAFADATYNVGCKTGTAQTQLDKIPNSTFIAFAPLEDPQIAVAVVVEQGGVDGLGVNLANVTRSIFDAYLTGKAPQTDAVPNISNQLLP